VQRLARSSRTRFLPPFLLVTFVLASVDSPGAASVIAPGSELWVKRYNGPGGNDAAYSVAVSPDTARVFVTGGSAGSTSGQDYATFAYDASSGTQLWARRYNGHSNLDDNAVAVAVSPDGTRVFVTGQSALSGFNVDLATLAYDASTGAKLWVKRFKRPQTDYAISITTSPDGTKVFMTAGFFKQESEYATLAYDASSGGKLWGSRYTGSAHSVAVSPDGTKVFVTGDTAGSIGSDYDYETLAYDASSGTTLWVKRYNGPADDYDSAYSVAVSPDGTKVFVTGTSAGSTSYGGDYATVAYDAVTGSELWAKRYNGPGNRDDLANSVAVSPDGTDVFVTGWIFDSTYDYATLAYDASSGAKQWMRRYDGNGGDRALRVAASPVGTKVFVTGFTRGSTSHQDYGTFAYDASTGAKLWLGRYNGAGNGDDIAYSVAVSPDDTMVFVTGISVGTTSTDYATIAYAA
jgi:outer membrane protein assembly factor BamB